MQLSSSFIRDKLNTYFVFFSATKGGVPCYGELYLSSWLELQMPE